MAKSRYVVWFDEVDKEDIGLVGGKGANLGEMVQAGLPVPPGFIITADAYCELIKHSELDKDLALLLKTLDHRDSQKLQKTAVTLQKIIRKAPIPAEITKAIFNYYHKLAKHRSRKEFSLKRIRQALKEPLVAIRSSATAEDLPDASFAGQQATFLNVQGDANVIEAVRNSWASLFTARAIFYRAEKGFDHMKVGIALPIQRMVESEYSGVMFTIDPVTNNKNQIVIEAIYGLGELIVQGAVTPDHYIVDKKKMEILNKYIGIQEKIMMLKNRRNIITKLTKKQGEKQKISDKQIVKLAQYGNKLEKHYFFPQDIEWAIEEDKIFIVQTRPVTTVRQPDEAYLPPTETAGVLDKELKLILTGNPASPGIASGRANIIFKASEISKIKGGDVLVAPMTNPDFVPAMRRAVAVVTEKGGRTSHAAIVSRELGIPAIVGVSDATGKLTKFQTITVNGATGRIYRGGISRKAERMLQSKKPSFKYPKSSALKRIQTATHVYCNLATTERVEEVAQRDVDGVGLLRAEFMIADIGYHPSYLIKERKQKLFIDKMTDNLATFCKHFGKGRPVVYRATDFKTNEYKSLKGGELYEINEENPMLGFRGAFRYIVNPKVFQLELEVIKKVRNKLGYKNLWLMIPFVRTINELKAVKKLVQEKGLHRSGSFKLWMMVEIPSNVISIDEFIEVGIDGISIGSNDLTQLTLGIDRDSEQVAKEFNEFDPSVLWSLERVIKAAGKHKITSSICGQAPSDYPDLVEKLVRWGITSISVNPDAIERTREYIHKIENKIVKLALKGDSF